MPPMTTVTTPHLLLPLPDPIADRPPFLRRVDEVLVERSTREACVLCRGLGEVDIRPANVHGTPLVMPCPHCQQHIPLLLRYLPTGDNPDASSHDRPGGQHPR